jgi:magnesium-protoporphyrin IX monomethyl ester (oxidative) cyclase
MAPDLATKMVNALVSRYSDRANSFWCVDNILPREYVDTVLPSLRSPEQASFFYEVKPDLSGAQLQQLAEARVNIIQPGIESFATSTLKLMGKGATAIGNVKFLMNCKTTQVKPLWNLIVGFPGEPAEVYAAYQKFLPDLFHLPPPQAAYPIRFDRFSPYFNKAKEYGLRLEPLDYYGLCYPFAPSSLTNIAYFFQDTNYGAKYILDMVRAISGLRQMAHRWQELWSRNAGSGVPSLKICERGDGYVVEDGRSGVLSASLISQQEVDLLAEIATPVNEESVLKKYGPVLEGVRKKRLIFSDRGKIMSIVPGLSDVTAVSLPLAMIARNDRLEGEPGRGM